MPNAVPELGNPVEGGAQHTPVKIPEEVLNAGVEPVHETQNADEIVQNHPAEDVVPSKTEALHTHTNNSVPSEQFKPPVIPTNNDVPADAKVPSLRPNKKWGP